MKRYLSWLAAGLVGGVIGASITERTFRKVIPSHIATRERDQEYSCMVSLNALAKLEAGDAERAKSILAYEVASFYYHPWQPDAPQRQKILGLIEEIKPKFFRVLEQSFFKLDPARLLRLRVVAGCLGRGAYHPR